MTQLASRDNHRFEAAGRSYLYLVPSAAIFDLDGPSLAVMDALEGSPRDHAALVDQLSDRFEVSAIRAAVEELVGAQAIGRVNPVSQEKSLDQQIIPLMEVPLSTLVVNVTNQCNLSCEYCYEYGEDKLVDTASGAKPKFMDVETARESVDFMFKASGSSDVARLTFFGGETLLNFPVLQEAIPYAREQAAALGKRVEFSLTTNATLLRPEIIEFLAENDIGVTVSIDGPKDMQDRFRVFHDGRGSYDVVLPKIKALLARHRSRPIGARVTLTSEVLDVVKIYRHLTSEVGFWEVGFAPVTTSPGLTHALGESGFDQMLAQFRELADDFLAAALDNRHHGFTNVRDTLEEIHKGASKAYPCGAGIGLLGVATDGDVALCHRFAGSDTHKMGTVREGINHETRREFLEKHHIDHKTDCHSCWARPLCAGGCYHEAQVRYGATTAANLHYCDWIRAWTDTCLKVYGEIAERNPAYFRQFDGDPDQN